MSITISKSDLVDSVSALTGQTKKDVKATLDAAFEEITGALGADNTVQLHGFGTFEVRERQARTGVRPGTTEKIQIPAAKYPAFKASAALKAAVNDTSD